eukprot:11216668-Lingulodinium_polyedra.AAC.1
MVEVIGGNWEEVAAQHYGFRYDVDFLEAIPWQGLPQVVLGQVQVLKGLVVLEDNTLGLDSEMAPLAGVLEFRPP